MQKQTLATEKNNNFAYNLQGNEAKTFLHPTIGKRAELLAITCDEQFFFTRHNSDDHRYKAILAISSSNKNFLINLGVGKTLSWKFELLYFNSACL
jgi:hypothetical protein